MLRTGPTHRYTSQPVRASSLHRRHAQIPSVAPVRVGDSREVSQQSWLCGCHAACQCVARVLTGVVPWARLLSVTAPRSHSRWSCACVCVRVCVSVCVCGCVCVCVCVCHTAAKPAQCGRRLCCQCQSCTREAATIKVSCPYRLVVRTSRCGRDNPGSTPGGDILPGDFGAGGQRHHVSALRGRARADV